MEREVIALLFHFNHRDDSPVPYARGGSHTCFLLNRPLENYNNQDIGLVRGILYFEISNNGYLQQVSGLIIW